MNISEQEKWRGTRLPAKFQLSGFAGLLHDFSSAWSVSMCRALDLQVALCDVALLTLCLRHSTR